MSVSINLTDLDDQSTEIKPEINLQNKIIG